VVQREGDVLKVLVKSCSLTRPDRYSEREHVVAIRAGVARSWGGDSFEMRRHSDRQLVEHSLKPGETAEIAPFELSIPVDDFDIDRNDWLTFEITNMFLRDGKQSGGLVPVHARIQLPGASVSPRNTEVREPIAFRAYSDPALHGVAAEVAGRISQEANSLSVFVDSFTLLPSDQYPSDERKVVARCRLRRQPRARLPGRRSARSRCRGRPCATHARRRDPTAEADRLPGDRWGSARDLGWLHAQGQTSGRLSGSCL